MRVVESSQRGVFVGAQNYSSWHRWRPTRSSRWRWVGGWRWAAKWPKRRNQPLSAHFLKDDGQDVVKEEEEDGNHEGETKSPFLNDGAQRGPNEEEQDAGDGHTELLVKLQVVARNDLISPDIFGLNLLHVVSVGLRRMDGIVDRPEEVMPL